MLLQLILHSIRHFQLLVTDDQLNVVLKIFIRRSDYLNGPSLLRRLNTIFLAFFIDCDSSRLEAVICLKELSWFCDYWEILDYVQLQNG